MLRIHSVPLLTTMAMRPLDVPSEVRTESPLPCSLIRPPTFAVVPLSSTLNEVSSYPIGTCVMWMS